MSKLIQIVIPSHELGERRFAAQLRKDAGHVAYSPAYRLYYRLVGQAERASGIGQLTLGQMDRIERIVTKRFGSSWNWS